MTKNKLPFKSLIFINVNNICEEAITRERLIFPKIYDKYL